MVRRYLLGRMRAEAEVAFAVVVQLAADAEGGKEQGEGTPMWRQVVAMAQNVSWLWPSYYIVRAGVHEVEMCQLNQVS